MCVGEAWIERTSIGIQSFDAFVTTNGETALDSDDPLTFNQDGALFALSPWPTVLDQDGRVESASLANSAERFLLREIARSFRSSGVSMSQTIPLPQ